jgi:hypothetical protein
MYLVWSKSPPGGFFAPAAPGRNKLPPIFGSELVDNLRTFPPIPFILWDIVSVLKNEKLLIGSRRWTIGDITELH